MFSSHRSSTRTPLTISPRAYPLGAAPWAARLDVETALAALESRGGLVCLDSAGGAPARWSLIAFDPLVSFEGADAPADLDGLAAALARVELDPKALADPLVASSPFCGGFVGALAYDLGVRGEVLDLPPPGWPAPPIVGGLYGDWLLIESGSGGATLFLSDAPGRAPAAERSAAILGALEEAATGPRPGALAGGEPVAAARAVPAEEHMARIDRTRALIEAGEIYQANVAHRLNVDVAAADVELYRTLRAANPAPYMGLCRFRFSDGAAGALLSSSPELLLELGPDATGARVARTRPIKGTAPRGESPAEDAASRARLLASDKDLAELAMIVDLERNDLGRVAEAGGVEVRGFPTLESYASVHHLVADVRARLRPDATAVDVIGALFPGGSITGAPKLRSMEAIAALEGEGRGFFTGSLGFVDARGRAVLNILIRTLVHRETDAGREVSLHVGGGITWRSDPALEDAETGHKADGLLRALAPHAIGRAAPHEGDLQGGRLGPSTHTQR